MGWIKKYKPRQAGAYIKQNTNENIYKTKETILNCLETKYHQLLRRMPTAYGFISSPVL